MIWAIPAGMALLKGIQGEQARKHTKKMNNAQAEIEANSYWTGRNGQLTPNNNSFLGGAVNGAVGGLMMAQSADAAGLFGGGEAAATAGTTLDASQPYLSKPMNSPFEIAQDKLGVDTSMGFGQAAASKPSLFNSPLGVDPKEGFSGNYFASNTRGFGYGR